MTLLIIGSNGQAEECKAKFGPGHTYLHTTHHSSAAGLGHADVAFDFMLCEVPEEISFYAAHAFAAVFLNSVACTLKKLVNKGGAQGNFFIGFNGLPTFLNRPLLEVCLLSENDSPKLGKICAALGTGFSIVPDRVGMVTARVVTQIINEAYLTLEEGTATREDIDMAMKLGTNYPFGPFEWGDRIGLRNVCQVLQNLKNETGDPRYAMCVLLEATAQHQPSRS